MTPNTMIVEVQSNILSREFLVNVFQQHLDSSVMALLEDLKKEFGPNVCRSHIYHYFDTGNPVLQRNRMQAVKELPWLMHLLVRIYPDQSELPELAKSPTEIWSTQQQSWAATLSHIIDEGQPLFSQVAKLFQVPYETIKWTRHQSLYRDEIFTVERTAQLLQILSAIEPAKRPNNKLAWYDLVAIIRPLALFVRPFSNNVPTPDRRNSQLKMIGEVLDDSITHEILCDRLRELRVMKLDLESGNSWLFDRIINVFDFLKTLRVAVKWHHYAYQDTQNHIADGASDFVMRWMRTKTLRQLANISDAWHRANHLALEKELSAKLDTGAIANTLATQEWPLILSAPFVHDEYTITELENELELMHEGREMQHCVATYVDKCKQGDSVIFSMKNFNKSKNATLELMIRDQDWRLQIVSLFGLRNEQPSAECQGVANVFLCFLNTENFLDALQKRREFQKNQEVIVDQLTRSNTGAISNYQLITQQVALECAFGVLPSKALQTLMS